MSYIYKNIVEGTAYTELIALNSITSWETITIANTGADSIINVYLYKVLEAVTDAELAQGIGEAAETIYVLHDTAMTADVTLVLDPSDFDFDNSKYSLRFETTTSADITINIDSKEVDSTGEDVSDVNDNSTDLDFAEDDDIETAVEADIIVRGYSNYVRAAEVAKIEYKISELGAS
jgi:hypothetical protein